jgi:hypothetical protein
MSSGAHGRKLDWTRTPGIRSIARQERDGAVARVLTPE